jgi:hypothetical protein
MTEFVYRKLTPERALSELEQLRLKGKFVFDLEELDSPGFYIHPNFHPLPSKRYAEIREKVSQILSSGNVNSKQDQSSFDQLLIKNWKDIFHDLTSFDAAQGGTWSFLTLRVLYDFGLMRFPNHADERYLGKARNVFWRLNQRVEVLGEDLACNLLEDESVQILERTDILGSNPTVARALANSIIRSRELHGKGAVTFAVRETAKEILREFSVLSYYAISETDMQEKIEALMLKQIKNYGKQI